MTLIDGIPAAAVLAGLVLNAAAGWWWADLAAGHGVGLAARPGVCRERSATAMEAPLSGIPAEASRIRSVWFLTTPADAIVDLCNTPPGIED